MCVSISIYLHPEKSNNLENSILKESERLGEPDKQDWEGMAIVQEEDQWSVVFVLDAKWRMDVKEE